MLYRKFVDDRRFSEAADTEDDDVDAAATAAVVDSVLVVDDDGVVVLVLTPGFSLGLRRNRCKILLQLSCSSCATLTVVLRA